MSKECVVCRTPITHHHKYCEKHYPHKSALILTLKTENNKLKKEIVYLNYLLNKDKEPCEKCEYWKHQVKSLKGQLNKI